MARSLHEYVGGPLDMERPDVDTAPVVLHDGGVYAPHGTIVDSHGVKRTALRWAPARGGRRNPPECRERCSPGCPAPAP